MCFARNEAEVRDLLLKNGVTPEKFFKRKEVFEKFDGGQQTLRSVIHTTRHDNYIVRIIFLVIYQNVSSW